MPAAAAARQGGAAALYNTCMFERPGALKAAQRRWLGGAAACTVTETVETVETEVGCGRDAGTTMWGMSASWVASQRRGQAGGPFARQPYTPLGPLHVHGNAFQLKALGLARW